MIMGVRCYGISLQGDLFVYTYLEFGVIMTALVASYLNYNSTYNSVKGYYLRGQALTKQKRFNEALADLNKGAP